MTNCEEFRGLLHASVGGELPAAGPPAIQVHLVEYPACAAEQAALHVVVDTVRGARPIRGAPWQSREAVRRLVADPLGRVWRRRAAMAAACAALLTIAVFAYSLMRNVPFERFAASAAGAHQRFVVGGLSLDLRSDDGPAVPAWLRQRLPFPVTLPECPDPPGGSRNHTLVCARACRMREKAVSLPVAAASAVGRIIAWSDPGVSHALVSGVQGSAAASRVVCHGPRQGCGAAEVRTTHPDGRERRADWIPPDPGAGHGERNGSGGFPRLSRPRRYSCAASGCSGKRPWSFTSSIQASSLERIALRMCWCSEEPARLFTSCGSASTS